MAKHPNPALPRALPLLAGLTVGVLLTLALQVLLNAHGFQIAEVWRDVAASGSLRVRAAMVWWVIAGSALVAGLATAAVLGALPPPSYGLRLPRWMLAALAVFGLAHVAHGAAPPDLVSAPIHLLATTAATCFAALMASFGAYFALRR
jgi:hypothetical protein